MSEFAFLFRGRDTDASPERMQKYGQDLFAWFKRLGDEGYIKALGHPLEQTGKVVKGKQRSVVDGPYAEAKDVVNGYTVIEAKDIAHAVEVAKSCPIFDLGGFVEVRPIRILNM
jgi:hypothetical protein